MANTIEKVALIQMTLDKAMIQGAVTGFMEGNVGNLIYKGGDEVKIPMIDMLNAVLVALPAMGVYERAIALPEAEKNDELVEAARLFGCTDSDVIYGQTRSQG